MVLKNMIFIVVVSIALGRTAGPGCGRPHIPPKTDTAFKITGGTEAIPYSWPWQVLVQIVTKKGRQKISGATLINSEWLLSAAHIFHEKNFTQVFLTFGIFDRTKYEPGSIIYTIKHDKINTSIITHPDYINITSPDDIALIKLPKNITFTDHISPVCLPRRDAKVNVPGKRLMATGWGKVNATSEPAKKLRQVVVPIQPDDQQPGCQYRSAHFDKNKQICAGGVADPTKKGACVSDSGGPLVKKKNNNKWFQYGVISGGIKPCGNETEKADIYTRVAYYCDWIEQKIGKSICRPKKKL